MDDLALRATIWASLAAWVLAERWRARPAAAASRRARIAWTVGAAAALAHTAVAFHVRHGWSHAAAHADTARQTREVFGTDWGGGLWVNYAFLALWAADVLWWWTAPGRYLARPRALDGALRGFLLFMFLNGAVVFGRGPVRWAGAVALGLVVHAWYRRAGAEPIDR